MRILVATDAWRPQVNGVVRTYERLADEVRLLGGELVIISPAEFNSIPCPTYPEIRLALPGYGHLKRRIAEINADAIHIATEGPVGLMTRSYCLGRKIPFTTAYHTLFPEYITPRFGVPASWIYPLQRTFHNAGRGMMIASPSLARQLSELGFRRPLPWTRGVDTTLFKPRATRHFGADPVFLYVGRVAVEKNVTEFLDLELPGNKVVVGDGPLLDAFRTQYRDVTFTGRLVGEELAEAYASADVFVFPSRTDTFGIVLIEAMACGLPIAALPVPGPSDNVVDGQTGYLDNDLRSAAIRAMQLDRLRISSYAQRFTWRECARLFIDNIIKNVLNHAPNWVLDPGLQKRCLKDLGPAER